MLPKKVYSKRLRLPMRFIDGAWELEFGGQVPVAHETKAEMLVDVRSITDQNFRRRMLAQSAIRILEPGKPLRAYLATKDLSNVPKDKADRLIHWDDAKDDIALGAIDYASSHGLSFIDVKIGPPTDKQSRSLEYKDGGLWLIVQGFTPSELRSSTIELPGIFDEPAISLNHAFTMLSEVFEPWRMSHTGNVYERFLYQESNGKWYPLEWLRDASLAKKEEEIAYKLWQDFCTRMKPRT